MTTAIIGGGVIGLNTAWSLTRRGEDVIVLEGGRIGSSASGVNAGWVTPSLSTPLASPGIVATGIRHMFDKDGALTIRPRPDTAWIKWLWNFSRAARPAAYERGVKALLNLNEHTMDLFDQLHEDGVEFEMQKAGILALALQPGGLGWFRQLFDQLTPMGFKGTIEYLTPAEARAMDQAVGPDIQEAAHTLIDRFVDPDGLLTGLVTRLTELGVKVHEDRPVSSMSRSGSKWILHTQQGPVEADNVVVALGAAANRLLCSIKVKLPIIGAKGYSVDLKGSGVPPRHALYLMEAKLGLSPLEKGVRIAGFFELPGSGNNVPQRRITQLIEQTRPYMGGWSPESANITTGRGGLRPSTPDSLPFIGPVPNQEGLYVAAGHGMLGVTLAPATAAALTSMIVDRVIPEHILPFQLAGRI